MTHWAQRQASLQLHSTWDGVRYLFTCNNKLISQGRTTWQWAGRWTISCLSRCLHIQNQLGRIVLSQCPRLLHPHYLLHSAVCDNSFILKWDEYDAVLQQNHQFRECIRDVQLINCCMSAEHTTCQRCCCYIHHAPDQSLLTSSAASEKHTYYSHSQSPVDKRPTSGTIFHRLCVLCPPHLDSSRADQRQHYFTRPMGCDSALS